MSGGLNEYQIYEYVETDGEEAVILPRRIPNPAPLEEGEVRNAMDDDGNPVWYIGRQGIVGPTDEEPWSKDIPVSYIELKRIQERYLNTMLDISGVHGFGLGANGFTASLLPEYADNADLVPTEIEDIPVTVELRNVHKSFGHAATAFRPIPVAAGIGSLYNGGTLGPHVVRDRPHVMQCCTLWSLTAAHVVRQNITSSTASSPTPIATIPTPRKVGNIAYAFTLVGCGPTSSECERVGYKNRTSQRPDAAAIQTAQGARTPPYNAPWEDEDPTRRMYYKHDKYENGPSGKIKEACIGKKLMVWGAQGGANKGEVTHLNQCIVVDYGHAYARICGVTFLDTSKVLPGDSGALVAWRGTSNRHVVGLFFAGDPESSERSVIPAMDLKDAFATAGKAFSHFWGTKEGYRRPATN